MQTREKRTKNKKNFKRKDPEISATEKWPESDLRGYQKIEFVFLNWNDHGFLRLIPSL